MLKEIWQGVKRDILEGPGEAEEAQEAPRSRSGGAARGILEGLKQDLIQGPGTGVVVYERPERAVARLEEEKKSILGEIGKEAWRLARTYGASAPNAVAQGVAQRVGVLPKTNQLRNWMGEQQIDWTRRVDEEVFDWHEEMTKPQNLWVLGRGVLAELFHSSPTIADEIKRQREKTNTPPTAKEHQLALLYLAKTESEGQEQADAWLRQQLDREQVEIIMNTALRFVEKEELTRAEPLNGEEVEMVGHSTKKSIIAALVGRGPFDRQLLYGGWSLILKSKEPGQAERKVAVRLGQETTDIASTNTLLVEKELPDSTEVGIGKGRWREVLEFIKRGPVLQAGTAKIGREGARVKVPLPVLDAGVAQELIYDTLKTSDRLSSRIAQLTRRQTQKTDDALAMEGALGLAGLPRQSKIREFALQRTEAGPTPEESDIVEGEIVTQGETDSRDDDLERDLDDLESTLGLNR